MAEAPEGSSTEFLLGGSELHDWNQSSGLEWLVTNGIGGYASGTLSGANTRRYHGALMAALQPPGGRTLLVARLEETLTLNGTAFSLSSDEWWDESVGPKGFQFLESFRLEDGLPVVTYRVGDYCLEKRIWMEQGENLTWVNYRWADGAPPALLSVRLFLAHRDFHYQQHGSSDWHWHSAAAAEGVMFSLGDIRHTAFKCSALNRYGPENAWYWGFLHRVERERGLDDTEDLWVPGSLEIPLCGGASEALLMAAGDTTRSAHDHKAALQRELDHRKSVRKGPLAADTRPETSALLASADAFLVRRPLGSDQLPDSPNTIVAGYHWFGDWGRDTMISLPGLALTTRRFQEARAILAAYSHFLSEGMLPNRFPDSGEIPEYNTVDATLWYFIAIQRYLEASKDWTLLEELYPALREIIDWHRRGTRHGIQMDPEDGLLRAGAPGSQLTWMDAKVGDWVVTPRMGKPVEIAALWLNALSLMEGWADRMGEEPAKYGDDARRGVESFARRFWLTEGRYLCDVIDGPDGDDHSFRPNQLIAIGLPLALLPKDRARSVVDACEDRLLTPSGLRTLDPADPRYVGVYGGDQRRRDGCYHQGTVWAWLIGPFVDAVLNACDDPDRARAAVEPLLARVREAGVGTLSEIYDGDAPHYPRGCISQAWSVAEALRSLERLAAPPPDGH